MKQPSFMPAIDDCVCWYVETCGFKLSLHVEIWLFKIEIAYEAKRHLLCFKLAVLWAAVAALGSPRFPAKLLAQIIEDRL